MLRSVLKWWSAVTVSGLSSQVGVASHRRAAGPAPGVIATADSLIAALCREADGLRQRGRQLLAALERCQHTGLRRRLEAERAQLERRRQALLAVATDGQRRRLAEPLSLALLAELAGRPLRPVPPDCACRR